MGKHKQRKLKSKSKDLAASKAKYRAVPAAKLPWRASKDSNYDFDDFQAGEGGMLELEEIDGVDVVWEERPDGSKTIKFNVSVEAECKWTFSKTSDHVLKMMVAAGQRRTLGAASAGGRSSRRVRG